MRAATPDWPSYVTPTVRGYLLAIASYAESVMAGPPPVTMAQALKDRPDVSAFIGSQLAESEQAALQVLASAWSDTGEDKHARAVFSRLAEDVTRAHGDVPAVRQALRAGAADPRAAMEAYARSVALRVTMSVQHAVRYSGQVSALQGAGKGDSKRWVAHPQRPNCCHWCKSLHGVTIGVHEDFLPHLAGAAALSKTGKLTQPPKAYLGRLLAPPLHPWCNCRLEVVSTGQAGVSSTEVREGFSALPFLASSDIRSMPAPKYRLLVEFLRAAAHELGAVLRRLSGG